MTGNPYLLLAAWWVLAGAAIAAGLAGWWPVLGLAAAGLAGVSLLACRGISRS